MTPTRDRTAWLQGGDAVCLQPPPEVKRMWRLVLLGPPGVGKGTLAELLFNALGACPLSTGDVLRAARGHALAPGSALADAVEHMEHGELVPDDAVLTLLRERSRCLHCRGGFLLDGFPRTLTQARALDRLVAEENIALDAVINLELSQHKLISRFSGRRVCPRCKAVFHLARRKPRVSGWCDECGGPLAQRPEDQPEAVCSRLEAYATATAPVVDHYRSQHLLMTIDADGEPVDILAHTLDALVPLATPA